MATIAKAIRDEMDRFAMQLVGMVEDSSTVPDENVEAFVTLRREAFDLSSEWAKAWTKASSFALAVAIRHARMRKLILRSDGAPDLAGNTQVWSRLVEGDIRQMLDGMDPKIPIEVFRSRVKTARSDHKVNFAVAAELAVELDPELAETKVEVNVAVVDDDGNAVEKDGIPVTETVEKTIAQIVEENGPGVTSKVSNPPELVAAVEAIFETQTANNGNRLSGFEAKDIPPTFGMQPKVKATRKASTSSNIVADDKKGSSTNVEVPAWANLVRFVRQSLWTETMPHLHEVLTALSDAQVASVGAPSAILPAPDRETVGTMWKALADLGYSTGAFVYGAPDATVEAIAPYRYAPTKPVEETGVEAFEAFDGLGDSAHIGGTETETEEAPETAPETVEEAPVEETAPVEEAPEEAPVETETAPEAPKAKAKA